MACHLKEKRPGTTFAILEARGSIGGTWDLFRYPGIRSDSDMHTLGFEFKPWTAKKSIADAPSIMAYLRETVDEHGLADAIAFQRRVASASWSSDAQRWSVEVSGPSGPETYDAGVLAICAGYYSYDHGYQPEFLGRDDFKGTIVHPQAWPEDLDYSGKRVAVIGSGATAVTIVPKVAATAAKVTMLQRRPTYMVAGPDHDWIANLLRKLLPDAMAYRITRAKNTAFQQYVYRRSRRNPEKLRRALLKRVARELPKGYDVDRHFTPSYNPWDERLCLVTNGDLFEGIREGKVEMVTDTIERFDASGIVTTGGTHIDADIIVTATGLEMVALGEIAFNVDGRHVNFADTWTYKGYAYSGVPNLISVFGYVNASWTLRADLISANLCRILDALDERGAASFTPTLKAGEEAMPRRHWLEQFQPGYVQRAAGLLPAQGDHAPWLNPQDYRADRKMFLEDPVDDGWMTFAGAR